MSIPTIPPPAVTPAPESPVTVQAHAGGSSFEWAEYAGPAGTRRYKLFIPSSYDAHHPAPLLVMLHGCTQDPDDFARGTRMNALAEEAGVIVAWPEQPAAAQIQKCWTWYDPAHQAAGSGEPGVIAGITQQVMERYKVDAARVFIAGVSAGGAMAVNVAASYPRMFAAVGAHSSIAYRAAGGVQEALGAMQHGLGDPARLRAALPAGPLPRLLVIHGEADAVVRPANGAELYRQWADALGGNATEHADSASAGTTTFTRRWVDGADGRPAIEQIVVHGLGHAWSGGSADGTYTSPIGPDASREMMRFFLGREAK
ncbi:MAG TPA: PHB depolymerase family esterase [Longimicrobiaceae bacterium]|nr:PHB depolymerase family esterase [Longimicrobiaceae bacterium]